MLFRPPFIFLLVSLCLTTFSACGGKVVNQPPLNDFPPVVLWAWERPENLEFLDADKFAVAFLAQTLILENEEVTFRPRRQPLKVSPQTKLIAVTRIEGATQNHRSALSNEQRETLVERVLKTLELKNVSSVQIDFDAAASEREFYRKFLIELRQKLPENVSLSITALASFCIGDRWFRDLPVAEAVPMIFRMGADDRKIKDFLANGNDFAEPLCRKSYGVASDEPVKMNFDKSRRLWVFNVRAWTPEDVEKISSTAY